MSLPRPARPDRSPARSFTSKCAKVQPRSTRCASSIRRPPRTDSFYITSTWSPALPGSCFFARERHAVREEMTGMIEVWGRRSSINVQKVMWMIGEFGLEHTRHSVGGSFGGNRESAFLAMNPNGLVPVIRDGDIVMFESNAIVRYLAARYGEGGVRPSSPGALAAAEQWMEWQQTTVAPLIGTIFMNKVRRPAAECDHRAVEAAAMKLHDILAIADRAL